MERFTKAKSMVFPREVLAGHNVLPQVVDICKRFSFGNIGVLVTGPTTGPVAAQKVSDELSDAKYEIHTIELTDATREHVDETKALVKEVKAKFLLGVGGGSKIDIAKLAAAELDLPMMSIPTSASHDGIASPSASILDDKTPHSIEAVMPMGILADTHVISKAPYRLLASGCADVLSNLTAIRDWELAVRLKNEDFSSTASILAKISAETILRSASMIKPMIEESVWIAVKPIISSGISMSMAGSSRPTSGSEHMFSHALVQIAPGKALHGEQCGVGCIMMMYLHGGNWEEIRNALKEMKAPTTAKELGVSKTDIIRALTQAHTIRPDRYTILGDNGLTPEAAENLAKLTGVI